MDSEGKVEAYLIWEAGASSAKSSSSALKPKSPEIPAASSALEEMPLCLSPDSLITLADGSQKPLIALKPQDTRRVSSWVGDMVLSLNEATGGLEPHRVLALLDMGVKPVYRLTTASGKQLKTTLTHPYLTRNGWRKLSEIKVGEEVAAANNPDRPLGAQRIKGGEMQRLSRKEKSRAGIRTDKHWIHSSQSKSRGKDNRIITAKMIFPDKFISIKEYFPVGIYDRDVMAMQVKVEPANGLAKVLQGEFVFPEVLVEGRGEFRDGEAGDEDLIVRRRENPINNLRSFFPAIAFNEDAGIQKINHLFFFPQASYSFSQTSFNFAQPLAYMSQGRDFLGKQGFRDIFIPRDYRDASASKPCKSNMLFRNRHYHHLSYYQNDYLSSQSLLAKIYHFLNILSRSIFPSAFAQGEASDILWDKIISIDYLGNLPVYDLEVEDTHNFIAQGIVAHNTYTTGEAGRNQKPSEGSAADSPLEEIAVVKERANDLGGVNFMNLPIITQPEITPGSIMAGSPVINLSHLELDGEWAQIQNMLNAGITPSSERIREYALASSSLKSEDYSYEIDKLLGCIADILRLEEERVLPTEPTLREMLVLLESDKPANELQLALTKIIVLPKAPQKN